MSSERARTGVCLIRVAAGAPITIRANTDVDEPGGETVDVVATRAEAVRVVQDFLDRCAAGLR